MPATTVPASLVAPGDLAEGNAKLLGSAEVAEIGGRAAAAANVTYGGYASLQVLFLVRVAGLDPASVGLLTAVTGVGGILGALIARPLSGRLGTARAMVFTFPVNAAGLLLPLTHTGPRVAFYIAGAFALGARMLISNVITGAFRQSYCPPGMLGRVTAGTRFLSYTAMPAGALIAGSLGTSLGVRNALWIFVGANALAGLLLCTPALLSSRDLPSRPAARIPP